MIEQSSMSAVVAEEDSPIWLGFAHLTTVSFDNDQCVSPELLPGCTSGEDILSAMAQSEETLASNR